MGSINVYAIKDVSKVNNIRRTKPFPNILPARKRSPCPSAMAANGAPPPPTIAEKEEIKIMRELRSYCGKCHFKDERQHTFRPQPFFVFIYHSTLLFLKLAAKLQEKQASRFKVEG